MLSSTSRYCCRVGTQAPVHGRLFESLLLAQVAHVGDAGVQRPGAGNIAPREAGVTGEGPGGGQVNRRVGDPTDGLAAE